MKKNSKRATLALIAAISLCLSTLTACGSVNAGKNEKEAEEKPTYQIDVNAKDLDYQENSPTPTDVPVTTVPETTDEGEETTPAESEEPTDTPEPTSGGGGQGGGHSSNNNNHRHERHGLTYNDYASRLGEGAELASLYYWYDGSWVLAVLKPTANSSNKATDILEDAYLFPADRMEIFQTLDPDKKGRNVYVSGQDGKRSHITNPNPEEEIGVNTEVDLSVIYIGDDRFDLEDVKAYGQFCNTLNLVYTDKAIGIDLPSFAALTYSYVRKDDNSGQTFYIERCDAEGKLISAVPTWEGSPSGAEAEQRVTLLELNASSCVGEHPVRFCITEENEAVVASLTYYFEET